MSYFKNLDIDPADHAALQDACIALSRQVEQLQEEIARIEEFMGAAERFAIFRGWDPVKEFEAIQESIQQELAL